MVGVDEESEAVVRSTLEGVVTDEIGTFEAFFHEERDRLFGLLCLMTGNRHDAEDLSQEAFLTMWERWNSLSQVEDPTAYLRVVAVNAFRKRLRRAEIARRIGRRPSRPASSPEDTVVMHEALRVLSPRQRAALVLTELLGYSGEEAAKALGVKRSTIGALKYQGRAALKSASEPADD
jgi:RNA polymerase sigma-70 factor (ECF subfamily)